MPVLVSLQHASRVCPAPARRQRGPAQSQCELRELIYRYRMKTDANGQPMYLGPAIISSASAVRAVAWILRDEAVEVFGVLCRTTQRHIIGWHEVGRGSLNGVLAHPREVFKCAIQANADAIIPGHSHPSGDPCPSQVGTLLRIDVLDHVIVAGRRSVSLRRAERVRFADQRRETGDTR